MSSNALSDNCYNRKLKGKGRLKFKSAAAKPTGAENDEEFHSMRKRKYGDGYGRGSRDSASAAAGCSAEEVDNESIDAQAPKAQRKRKSQKGGDRTEDNEGDEETHSSASSGAAIPCNVGAGRIVSTGATVNGFETDFKDEVEPGDSVLVYHPVSLKVESRLVASILSQRCLTLGEGFSRDLVSTTNYEIRKDSVTLKKEAALEAAREKEKQRQAKKGDEGELGSEGEAALLAETDEVKMMQDIVSRRLQKRIDKSKKTTMTYRVKTGMWSYKTVTEEVESGQQLGADALLDRRATKNRDKHCW